MFTTGCATYNTATGRKELIFISTDSEVMLGQEFDQQIRSQYHISRNKSKVDRLNRIGQRLAQVSDRQDFEYHFNLVEQDEMNAFTIPGGRIYFFEGLFDKMHTDDEIAAVLAHEIGHSAAKHTVKKFQAALGYDLLSRIVLGKIGGEAAQQIASMGAGAIMNLAMSAYGRQDEYEADRLGIKYLSLAGYNLDAMIQTFEILKKETKERKGGIPFLRTHPYLDDRIIAARKEIEAAKEKY